MRSICRLAKWLPILAIPTLWKGKYMLNDANTNNLQSNSAEQVKISPQLVDILSEEGPKQDGQSSVEPKNQYLNQHEQLPKIQNQNDGDKRQQLKEGSPPQVEVTSMAVNKNDPQQIVWTPSTQQQGQPSSPTQALDINNLQPNQVLVSSACPAHLIRYFQLSNLQIIKSDQISQILILKNSRNDIYKLEKSSYTADNDYYRKQIANFIRPPQEVHTVQEAKQLLGLLSKDSFLVMAYIPEHQVYQAKIKEQTRSQFDTYTLSRKVDTKRLEQQYLSYAYRSSSNKNNFIIARTAEVANFLKMETFKIGCPYLLNKSSKDSGGESNFKEAGVKFKVTEVKGYTNDKDFINKMTHFYLNRIDNEAEMQNKIRQMVMSSDSRKILLFYTKEQRQQFHQKTEQILQKIARLQKQDVIIIKTSNQNVLKKVLKVEPDNFATIRLIDPQHQQKSLIGQQSQHYLSRQKYKGPFKIQNLCQFVSSNKWEEYYENKKKVSTIKAVEPSELQKLSNSLVLVEKQGCEGCRYVGQSLQELKKVIRGLGLGGRLRKQLIYRFRIQDPKGLQNLRLRRYSIFNDNQSFTVPSTTPRLYFVSQGYRVDLEVQKSLSKLNKIQKGQNPEQADDSVLADIIDKVRQHQNQPNYQL